VQGPVLQPFSYDEAHPYASGQHRGVDIGADAAGEAVVAPAVGTVSYAGTVPTNGKTVTIETADGYSVTLTHLGSIAVAKGATVAEQDVVGTIGPSGTPEVDSPAKLYTRTLRPAGKERLSRRALSRNDSDPGVDTSASSLDADVEVHEPGSATGHRVGNRDPGGREDPVLKRRELMIFATDVVPLPELCRSRNGDYTRRFGGGSHEIDRVRGNGGGA